MRQVRILAEDPEIDIKVDMGDGAANITAGLGGWQTVERIQDIALTDWQGQAPLQQDVPLLLDGWSKGESVDRELNTILKLGRDAVGHENTPPVFKVEGPIYFDDKHWVLPDGGIDLDADSVIRKGDGTLLRQALTLHLLEYVRPDQVRLRGKKGKAGLRRAKAVTYTTKKGDTLIGIAVAQYGTWTGAGEIGRLNGIGDPYRGLPAGRVLRLP